MIPRSTTTRPTIIYCQSCGKNVESMDCCTRIARMQREVEAARRYASEKPYHCDTCGEDFAQLGDCKCYDKFK